MKYMLKDETPNYVVEVRLKNKKSLTREIRVLTLELIEKVEELINKQISKRI